MLASNLTASFPVWTMLALGLSAPPGMQSDASPKTADDQRNNRNDLALTARIRQALLDDKALSIAAHNVKIITQNGMVTLRGIVKSAEEDDAVVARARNLAGTYMVTDSLSIAASKTNRRQP
jgi:osmotically-inducible protein OsmY